MSSRPLRAEIHARLHSHARQVLALPQADRERVLVGDLVEAVLASPPRLPPLPKLAEQHSARLAERVRSPLDHRLDSDADARERFKSWERWYAQVREFVAIEGVELLAQLARCKPEDGESFDELLEHIRSALSALRSLCLPWWPPYCEDRESWRSLTLLDYADRRLAQLETWQIRVQMPRARGSRG